ncbi:MAG: transketolase-like TK C-terminal-containing protein, partial [Vicinamibacteria bacterium]
LIPTLGLHDTIRFVVVTLAIGAAALVLWAGGTGRARLVGLTAAGLVLIPGAMLPRWDPSLLSSGAYKYASASTGLDLETALTAGRLLFYREGATATVAVREVAGTMSLAIDGKVDAVTTDGAILLGYAAENPDELEVVGEPFSEERYGVGADVWSVTSYVNLYRDGHAADRWNRLHPGEKPRVPYVTQATAKAPGVFVAASDYLKVLPDAIDRWLPKPLQALGTDGFGRSASRGALRNFFEVDARFITLATLYALF